MAFKPRPPKEETGKPTRPYKIEKAKDLDIPPAETFEELDERVRSLMKLQMKKGRPSDLRRRIEYLEAVCRKEGIIPDDNARPVDETNIGTSELE